MTTSFPCRHLFIISGFFHSKYDSIQNNFKISKILFIYGVVLTITIQSGNTWFIHTFLQREPKTTAYTYHGHELIGRIVLYLDNCFWLVINWIHPIVVVLYRDQIANYMNDFMVYEMNLSCLENIPHINDKTTRIWVMIWLSVGCLVFPATFVLEGLYSGWNILVAIPLSIDYMIGHLFEFVFLQKVRKHFSILRGSFDTDDHRKLYDWLTLEMQLTKLAKICTRLFAESKVVLLLAANVLISIYWFYNYDLNINVYGSLFWQLIVSAIFILCHIWDKMSSEVSETLFF